MPSISGRAFKPRTSSRRFIGGDRSRRRDGLAVHAEFGRRLRLAADINRRSGVFPHPNDRQSRRAPGVSDDALDARAALGFYLVTYTVTIENQGHQTNVPDSVLFQ